MNALAGRFITVKIYENKYDEAKMYYTSVFLANSFLAFIILLAGVFISFFVDKLIKVPENLVIDVKILFATLFLNTVISTAASVFNVATFATNKLYLSSIRNIETNVFRAIALFLMFTLLTPKVFYLGITALFTTIYCVGYNYYYIKKLTPMLKVEFGSFNMKAIFELVTSGVWSLVTRIGQILTDGLDLLITNLLIDATSMGVLSLAKTVPGAITGIVGTVVNSFSPNFTILYAENKLDELREAVKRSMKVMGVICNLPIVVLLVCGERFFALWQPTQNARELQVLSILTCAGLIVNGGINCIYNIFTVVNKLKFNSLVLLVSSLISVGVTYLVVKYTNLGVYAVAGVSTVIMIIKNVTLVVPYAAKCLNLKWYAFYPDVIRPIIFVITSTFVCSFIIKYITLNNWISLIICGIITVTFSSVIGYFVILRKKERQLVIGVVKNKVLKRRTSN